MHDGEEFVPEGAEGFVAETDVKVTSEEPPKKPMVGDPSPWSGLDPYDSDRLDAAEDGLIDRDGCFTESGVKYFEEKGSVGGSVVVKPVVVDNYAKLVEAKTASGEVSSEGKLQLGTSVREGFLSSSSGRRADAEHREAVRQKQIADDVEALIRDAGYEIEGVDLYPHPKEEKGEKMFGIKVTFYRHTKGGNKKAYIKAAGTEAELRQIVRTANFSAVPIVDGRRKAGR